MFRQALGVAWVLLLCAGVAQAVVDPNLYDAYKSVPDVDKPDRDQVGGWPDPGDKSCWQACAANLLGGAGYGSGANAQTNATSIYNQMVNHFGFAQGGDPAMATTWWLYNYGLDPAESDWYCTSSYTDTTSINKQLDRLDYDFLLDELNRCQYVAVSWEFWNGQTESPAYQHCLTLVGGNRSIAGPPNNVSIWHDSDNDAGGTDDDIYTNTFDPPAPGPENWHINYDVFSWAQGYLTLCPGLKKPESAVRNYDAAYYRDRPDGQPTAKAWRVIGENAANYGQPSWDPDGLNDNTILRVPNEEIEDMEKHIYLLVDHVNRGYDENSAPAILLRIANPQGGGMLLLDPDDLDLNDDGGQIMYKWFLDHQPAWEDIIFPSIDYHDLAGDIESFNIATECVPEPATIALIAIGGVALLRRRR
jgi:hypothetical protein